jgi:uncharacterized protein (TIGR03083 family)
LKLDAHSYLEHIKRDGSRIPDVAEGNFDKPVPSCPGNTVESLLMHTAGLYLFWSAAIEQNARPDVDWTTMNKDLLTANRDGLARFVDVLAAKDPDEPIWVWGRDPHMRFWYRRAAQELSIHRWDFENTVGDALPIDPALAVDGIQEFLDEFSPKPSIAQYKGAAQMFDGDGERIRLEATDVPSSWTLTARPESFEMSDERDADVNARAKASDLNLFIWGRLGPDALEVDGNGALLDRWHDRVKI